MTMNCVVLGPTEIKKISRFGKIRNIANYVDEIATFLVDNFREILIVPDEGLPLLIAQKYRELGRGVKVIGYIPDKSSGGKDISDLYKNCDEIRGIGGGWHNLNTELTRHSNNVFCFGFSAGVMIEIASIKYNQIYLGLDTSIFIDRRCISRELPDEIAVDVRNIYYFDNPDQIDKSVFG